MRQQNIEGLERLIQRLEEQRDYPGAITYARRILRQDPLQEDAYRSQMHLHALNRDRTSTLRTYHDCATVLRRELGVDPDPATHAMHERLLKAHVPPAQEAAAQPPDVELPLVGRQREWERLREVWRDATGGRSQVVLVAGEARIGKTRLAEELLRLAAYQGMSTARTRCYAAEGGLAYAPLTDWLRTDTLQEALRGLDGVWLTEVARLLPELLVERPVLRPPEALTQGWQRQRLFEALSRAVLAAKQPLLLVMDDLQWCDTETQEWLHHLARFDPSAGLLIVGAVRTHNSR